MAIVFPREDALKALGGGRSLEELCNDDKVANQVLKQLNEVGRKGGLKGQEALTLCILVPEELPMTGELCRATRMGRAETVPAPPPPPPPAQKLERGKVTKKYADVIKEKYV
jgi:long-chain acyl-CoA synthetase